MTERLSSDSGLHSISSPSSTHKIFNKSKKDEENSEPKAKRARKGDDARVPASRESSEGQSSDDVVTVMKQPFCEPSTSRVRPKKKEEDHFGDDENSADEEKKKKVVKKDISKKICEKCEWEGCEVTAPSINAIYDHVMETHISEIEKTNGEEEEELECSWGDCTGSMVRGDWSKKVKWLIHHFKQRHAKYAQTIKCVIGDCRFRCCSLGKLDDHIRKIHERPETEKEKVESPKKIMEIPKKRSKTPPRRQGPDLVPEYVLEYLKRKIRQWRRMKGRCEVRMQAKPQKGAAKRKSYAPAVMEILPLQPKPLPPPIPPEELYIDMSLGLEDLFPGWGYKPPEYDREIIRDPEVEEIKEEETMSDLEDIPVLEKISPIASPTKFLEDTPPLLLPVLSSSVCSSEMDIEACSLPSLDLYEECSKSFNINF